MSTYVIADRRSPDGDRENALAPVDLRTPVVPAIFTDHRAAERYLGSMGNDSEIARLSAMQLLRWMVRVYEQGTHYLLVNPRSARSDGDQSHGRLAIDQQLARFAELLTRDVVACAEWSKQDQQVTR